MLRVIMLKVVMLNVIMLSVAVHLCMKKTAMVM